MNIKQKVKKIQPKKTNSDWKGYEHAYGYGMMVLPFTSGHLLGFRVFPQNDFAPYKSLWHCNPNGQWDIYNDGPSLKTTCPRWWGPALRHKFIKPFELYWKSENNIHVEMTDPDVVWEMELRTTTLFNLFNSINAAVPRWKWLYPFQKKMHEDIANKKLGMGTISFSFLTPSGFDACILPEEIYGIKDSTAFYKGNNLGKPTKLSYNPKIGQVSLPKKPAFMIGHAYAKINNFKEYEATKAEVAIV